MWGSKFIVQMKVTFSATVSPQSRKHNFKNKQVYCSICRAMKGANQSKHGVHNFAFSSLSNCARYLLTVLCTITKFRLFVSWRNATAGRKIFIIVLSCDYDRRWRLLETKFWKQVRTVCAERKNQLPTAVDVDHGFVSAILNFELTKHNGIKFTFIHFCFNTL